MIARDRKRSGHASHIGAFARAFKGASVHRTASAWACHLDAATKTRFQDVAGRAQRLGPGDARDALGPATRVPPEPAGPPCGW